MSKSINISALVATCSKIGWLLLVLVCAAIIVFCGFYICSSHDHLASWFHGLNNCFYKQTTWSHDFFTPGIKSDGNMYAALAAFVSATGIIIGFKSIKSSKKPPPLIIEFDTKNLLPVLLLIAANCCLWYWGNKLAMPASDEVFSAQNVAEIHPFQAIAYYMLPNNHLLFNFINNTLFHPFADKVISGRLLSLFAYILNSLVLFGCFKYLIKNRYMALLACITLALQFQVWGFSFQARGYELYLLAETTLVVSLIGYVLSGSRGWLRVNMLASFIGFCCLPSFLYFFMGQVVFMGVYLLSNRSADFKFWKSQAIALSAIFLLYLPALCFSGLESITNNTYVASMNSFKHRSIIDFAAWMFPYSKPYFNHIFSDLQFSNTPVSILLLFLPPLLILCRTNKLYRIFGIIYTSYWLTFLAIAIVMKKLPFERNLIGHYSLALAGIVLLSLWLLEILARIGRTSIIKWILFPGILLFFAVHFARTNPTYLRETLYEYDVNIVYKEKAAWLAFIPLGSSVAVSEEDFYTFYICKQKGYKVTKCPTGTETYYMKEEFEEIPKHATGKYVLFKKFYGNEIWKLE